jgi:hypothetical protein
MCWNAEISINTFMFSCLALIFIFLSSTFTKYKSSTFTQIWVYLFFFEIASMQLVEYFLWKHLNHPQKNKWFSTIGFWIVMAQPLTLMMLIPHLQIKYFLLVTYALFIILSKIYRSRYPIEYRTSIGENGHLSWEWMNLKGYEIMFVILYLLFYVVTLFYVNHSILSMFILLTLLVSLFFYVKSNTFSTMWCWITNVGLLLFIVDILLVQPYREYNSLC